MHQLVVEDRSLALLQWDTSRVALQHVVVLRQRLREVWTALRSKNIMATGNYIQPAVAGIRVHQWAPQVERRVLTFIDKVEVLVCLDLAIARELDHEI